LQREVDDTCKSLKPIPARPMLKVAIGIAVPAIEAWYRCGVDLDARESNWQADELRQRSYSIKVDLKKRAYGTARTFEQQRKIAASEARRLSEDLETLESRFPMGFGMLAKSIRDWKQPE
jgi:hypothetical protein